MSRIPIPLASADVSLFARSLREQMLALGAMPSHVELLNMLARAGGYRNFQHLRSVAERAPDAPSSTEAVPPPVDHGRVKRVAGHFGPEGRLLRWPGRTNHQELCVWLLWARLPSREVLDERSISAWLDEHHEFGDAALLGRTMVDLGLVSRTPDGREYRRVERKPPPELAPLLALVAG